MESSILSQQSQTGNHSVNLNDLLLEYYKALTHLCTVGAKLASSLEDVLSICDSNHRIVKSMNPLLYLYKDILTSMGPLKEDTIFECCDEGQDEHYCKKVEACSAHLFNFHCQIIERGSQLIQSTGKYNSPSQPGSKHSPSIVVTDADRQSPLRLQTATHVVKPNSSLDSPSQQAKNHVPTDDDMNNIINFLSSTHIPKKMPLGNQRSSPLPKIASLTDDHHHSIERRLSDWQVYRNENVMCPSALSPGELAQASCSLPPKAALAKSQRGIPSAPTPNFNLSYASAPRAWMHQDKIWANNDSSSGDESLSTTDQLFNSHSLDLSGLVSQTRRSSHDSNASSQAFELNFTASQTTVQDDGWSRSSQICLSSETKQSFRTFNDNVWKPLASNDLHFGPSLNSGGNESSTL